VILSEQLVAQPNKRVNLTRPTVSVVTWDVSPRRLRAVRWARSEEAWVIVRPETDRDLDGIREVNIVAFQGHAHSQQTEHLIVEALRAAGALESSLVAESDGEAVGHIAFSAAGIGGSATGWFLLSRSRSGRPARARGSDARWSRPVLMRCALGEPTDVSWSEIQPSTSVSDSGSIRA